MADAEPAPEPEPAAEAETEARPSRSGPPAQVAERLRPIPPPARVPEPTDDDELRITASEAIAPRRVPATPDDGADGGRTSRPRR